MAQEFATFAYQDDTVLAFHGNHVIASGTNFAKVAETAEEYFNGLRTEKSQKADEEKRSNATHITTPNGETGTILGKTAGLWSDEITVRLANGEIRRYATYVGDGIEYQVKQADAPTSYSEYFQNLLDEQWEPTRQGLTARLKVLEDIRRDAAEVASSKVSNVEGQKLHQIVLAASAERGEVREALAYLEDADMEAMVPPTRAYAAVEQAEMGRSDSWLDVVASEMVAESEGQDFDRLLEEGPTEFVSSLDLGTLGHTGIVREMAREHVHGKTAGFQGEAVENYRDQFVAATEVARRQQLAYHKDATHKEAAQHEASVADVPDDALFM